MEYSDMNIERYIVGPLKTNAYLLSCETSGESVLIDPGGVTESLLNKFKHSNLTAILLTHCHFDHIAGADEIADLTGAKLIIHESEATALADPLKNGSFMFGTDFRVRHKPETVIQGDVITFGDCSLDVVHTPGHSTGSISFVDNGRIVFGGDTLFRMSVGRWDLPGGDYNTLMRTLETVFSPMDDTVVVYPGHGDETTIGFERRHNQFIN